MRKFTNDADKGHVTELFGRMARGVLAASVDLVFDQITVASGDGARLGATLALCSHVERLSLRLMAWDDAEVTALADSLGRGDLPKLHSLSLHDNRIGDAGAAALGRALSRGAMGSLGVLTLVRNGGISEEGRVALQAAAPSALKVAF